MQVMPAACFAMLLLSGDHPSCGSCQHTSCNIVAVCMPCSVVTAWRPYFVWVMPAVCLVMLLLYGDHDLCGLCQQYVM